MNDYTMKGHLEVVKDVHVISDRFKKREFVIKLGNTKYPQLVLFQLTQDNCNAIDSFNIGDEILVHFNISGRAWQKNEKSEVKYFNTLEAWRIETEEDNDLLKTLEDEYDQDEDLPF